MPLDHSGLDDVVAAETTLSMVDGAAGVLVIRGHRLEDIAASGSFEWLAGELWQGLVEANLSNLGAARVVAFERISQMLALTTGLAPLAGLRLLVTAGDDDPLNIVATVAVGLAAILRGRAGQAPVAPDPALGHAADLLRMLRGSDATQQEIAALQTYLLSAMDHGLNASTFTARVVASTRAGLPAAVTAALAALQGPLHGGAPGPVLDMLDDIGTPANAEAWLDAAVRGDRLMGFGHRIYRVRDPRSDVVKTAAATLGHAGRLRYAEAVERAALSVLARRKPDRSLQTNLEFYTALLLEALGIPRDGFTGIFAATRVAGWIAHAREQEESGRLIRPQSRYIGP